MANAASAFWPAVARQAWIDLQPAPGRAGMAWRVALLCSLVAATAMVLKIPESAISCYLVIFLMKPDAVQTSVTAIGLVLLATLVVVLMIPIIDATIDSAAWRLTVMFVASYIFLFLGSATPLGEQAAIVGLIIAFIMTLVTDVPVGQVADQGLLMAWKMASMPMILMVVFNLVFGIPAQTHVRNKIVERLRRAADRLAGADDADAVAELLGEGNDDALKQMQLVKALHLVPTARSTWLNGAVETSYRILVAVSAISDRAPRDRLAILADALRKAADNIAAGRVPDPLPEAHAAGGDVEDESARQVRLSLAHLAAPNGGGDPRPRKIPFLAPDAFTNPDHQRFALKTSAAAIICYLIYTGVQWDGIHTAMITCYVAALGSTGETVRKLALRIGGCLIGAALGVLALLFVMPNLTSVGGLMVLVFAGVLPAAWVSSGNDRISYAGVQIALAFLLTILNGFGPSFEMSQASDRIAGILLGNAVIYLIFTQVWPVSAMKAVRQKLAAGLDTLADLANRPRETRQARLEDVATAHAELADAAGVLETVGFEPRRLRPSGDMVGRTGELIAETRGLATSLFVTDGDGEGMAGRLRTLAAEVGKDDPSTATISTNGNSGSSAVHGDLDERLERIEWLARV
ncbi:FUSC family protein [Microbaculum sp. FT89]|uniref:FUSC family protein n=1 Tax=Microbaculum sp. FT89 TaxID=3447298 RepID=UPI003F535E5D